LLTGITNTIIHRCVTQFT